MWKVGGRDGVPSLKENFSARQIYILKMRLENRQLLRPQSRQKAVCAMVCGQKLRYNKVLWEQIKPANKALVEFYRRWRQKGIVPINDSDPGKVASQKKSVSACRSEGVR
jgi:hypothetical protein